MASTNLIPSDSNGKLRVATSLHYFHNGIVSDGSHTAQQNANALAAGIDIMVTQIGKLGSTSNNASYVPGMFAVNSDLIIAPYGKSIENGLPNNYGFPEGYFAHTAKPGTSANRINIFSGSIYEMQPDALFNFTDTRGFTSTSWKDWRAKDAQKNNTSDNTRLGFTLWKGSYLDSMGAGPSGAVNPTTGAAYAATAWHALANTVGDAVVAASPASQMVVGNGLGDGTKYYASASDLINHVNGGLAEGWLRGNSKSNSDTAMSFPALTDWKKDVQFVIDIEALNKYVWLVTNLWNDAANPALSNPSPFSAPQVDQWRQFIAATFLIAKGKYAHMEFVPDTMTGTPWDEIRDNPVYGVNLGAPLETATATGSSLAGATFYRKAGSDAGAVLYGRRYTTGIALVNPSATGITYTLDRSYKQIDGTPVAPTITVPAHTGMVLLLAAGTSIVKTDSGHVTDARTLETTRTRTDSSVGSDAKVLHTRITRTDSAVGSSIASVSILGGPRTISAHDAAAGADASSEHTTYARTDSAVGTDASRNATPVNVTDSGVGTEAKTLAVHLNRTDAGAGTDAKTLAVRLPRTDTGAASDVTALPKSGADSAVGTDAKTLLATYVVTEDGEGTDIARKSQTGPNLFGVDSARGTERSRVSRSNAVNSIQGARLEIHGSFKIRVGA